MSETKKNTVCDDHDKVISDFLDDFTLSSTGAKFFTKSDYSDGGTKAFIGFINTVEHIVKVRIKTSEFGLPVIRLRVTPLLSVEDTESEAFTKFRIKMITRLGLEGVGIETEGYLVTLVQTINGVSTPITAKLLSEKTEELITFAVKMSEMLEEYNKSLSPSDNPTSGKSSSDRVSGFLSRINRKKEILDTFRAASDKPENVGSGKTPDNYSDWYDFDDPYAEFICDDDEPVSGFSEREKTIIKLFRQQIEKNKKGQDKK